jgi:hypothetical protein
MSLLRFGQALDQTLRGIGENPLVRGGLGLMSANAPGQATPVDQPGSFLKGMLSANALRQNRLLQEEQAKERERQEAQRVAADQFFTNLAMQRQNQAMAMRVQQEIGQMQTPFNAADMRATLPADMQARSMGDVGQQTPIHSAPPVEIPAMSPTEMALASGVPGIRNKAFDAMLEQNENRGDLGINDMTPSNYTPSSVAEFISLMQKGDPQGAYAQLVPIDGFKEIVQGGRTYLAARTGDGSFDFKNMTLSPDDPQFKSTQILVANARKGIDATEELTNTNMTDINYLVNNLAGSTTGEWFGKKRAQVPGTLEADWYNTFDTVKSSTFLAGREALKGGGTITDYEGNMAQQALNKMNIVTSKKEFIKNARSYQKYLLRGLAKMQYIATNSDFTSGKTNGVIPQNVKDQIDRDVDRQMASFESSFANAEQQVNATGVGEIEGDVTYRGRASANTGAN